MSITIAHLGPQGTYAEVATLAVAQWLERQGQGTPTLCPYRSIAQTLYAVEQGETALAVVPIENSTEGSVRATLDTLWQLGDIQIQQAWTLPITHALISHDPSLEAIATVYSHPQALAQCHDWMQVNIPQAKRMPTSSTANALEQLATGKAAGAIASRRAAELYGLPVVAYPINDQPDNCTRFWVLSQTDFVYPDQAPDHQTQFTHTSMAFSLPKNVPGALLQVLKIFAERDLNLARIESRPTKRVLGEYLFFIDVERGPQDPAMQTALNALERCTEMLKVFGQYRVLQVEDKP
ncbi:MAG: prephenate dehydratase [Cyanobacteria bacterium P01_F01_bin.150]